MILIMDDYHQRAERELELANMEATRANNLIKHEDEIKSRRKRTWFKTEKEKKETRLREFEKKKGKKTS